MSSRAALHRVDATASPEIDRAGAADMARLRLEAFGADLPGPQELLALALGGEHRHG